MRFAGAAEYRAYWQKYRTVVSPAERWYRTLLDDEAGRNQWMQSAGNILGRADGKAIYTWRNSPAPNATNRFSYSGASLRGRTEPSVGQLLTKRALSIAPRSSIEFGGDCWTFQDAADLGLMLAEWEGKPAVQELGKIIRCCPALYAERERWTSGCAVVPESFAALAVVMAELGDLTGLDLYANWVASRTLEDLRDALPRALLPLGRFPNHPSIKEASVRLFQPANGDWLKPGNGWDPLGSRLLLNEAFRVLVRHALDDRHEFGTITVKNGKDFDIETLGHQRGGVLKVDGFTSRPGQVGSFRVCDDVAYRLSRIEGLPHLQLYWPEGKRDECLSDIIQFLDTRSDHLNLGPAKWPINEEE
jgi:hypothetical protein